MSSPENPLWRAMGAHHLGQLTVTPIDNEPGRFVVLAVKLLSEGIEVTKVRSNDDGSLTLDLTNHTVKPLSFRAVVVGRLG